MKDDETLRFYAQQAQVYANRDRVAPSARLEAFLAGLPADGDVLELGTGGGQDALTMIERGFAVNPTDGSPELAKEAEKRLGRPVAIMLFEELEAVDAYDGVWASASLLHAPREALTGILARVHRALRPGGLFMASFKGGKAEGRDTFGRFYSYLDEATLRRHYEEAGNWMPLVIDVESGSGYDRQPTEWLWVTARRG
ncbi:class I SAM-dependent DNA methyltransferase [Paradevosia shaoguanensis]|uniref:class I SAM-dependent DNA methyltransferase n=1 Tax=Paradevosia shaoguanensis TaxID=1335043 RepID=UPI0019334E3C|nr:class I SAM-dependent methyltransferase [Paradevosia shaoguanensis]